MMYVMEGACMWFSVRFHAKDTALVKQYERRGQLRDIRPLATSSSSAVEYFRAKLTDVAAPSTSRVLQDEVPSPTRSRTPRKKSRKESSPTPTQEIALDEELKQFEPIVFPPDTFEIVLCIDHREVKEKDDRYHIQRELFRSKMPHETINLAVGDFVWCARQHGELFFYYLRKQRLKKAV